MTKGMKQHGKVVMILGSWGVVVDTMQLCIIVISVNLARGVVYPFQSLNISLQSSILPANFAYFTILDAVWTNSSSL
jgi:hypothetical protein